MKPWLSPEWRDRANGWLKRQWSEWRRLILFFCLVWVPLRSSVVDYNPVPTGSMNPTILEGDVVWVNKLAYGLRLPLTQVHLVKWAEPQRGDIVVVLSPRDGTRLVKRVVAVPGDTLAMRDNRLELNGHTLDYAAIRDNYGEEVAARLRRHAFFAEENLEGVRHPVMGLAASGATHRTFAAVVVPAGKYFLMGDSRDNSLDSREFGLASRDAILGKAGGILVSLDINDSWHLRTGRTFTELR